MKNNNKLGVTFNIFSLSSKTNNLKEKLRKDKISSSKTLLPIHMSLMQYKRGNKKKSESSKKKTNRIFRLHKKNPKLKALEKMKKEINHKIFSKYVNPYMNNIHHMITPFSKEKKFLYYDYYQICYIFNKIKCSLYSRYKDFKIIYDNQDYFLKYFNYKESKVYLTYLVYIIYSKDYYVKSTRITCINKDIKEVKKEYNEYIINGVFNAKRLILSRDLNKYIPNIASKLLEKTNQKLSRIAIPKYKLILKPILDKYINYIYIKDVPNNKIPKIIPNYSKQDKRLYLSIKNYLLKKKFSILIINGKKVPKDKNERKYISKDLSILRSVKADDSEDYNIESSNMPKSKYFNNYNENQINNNIRNKKNNEINDIESLIYKLNIKIKNEEDKYENIDDIIKSNFNSSLNTIYENENEVFLSSLKKPFIGNRDSIKIRKMKNAKGPETERNIKNKSEELLNYTMEFINNNKNKSKKKFKLYLNLTEDEFTLNKKQNHKKNNTEKDIIKKYFPERFIDPIKYKEYLLKSPFLASLIKLKDPINPEKLNIINLKQKEKSMNILYKNNNKKFKDTYKFILDFNQKEKREELINNIINKSNKIYNNIKIITESQKRRNNFKKSGAFAFTSFKGIHFGKDENIWEDTHHCFKTYYDNSFKKSNLMRKINKENTQNEENFKKSTTFKEILKSSNIYL
jgi:hypothetical protein